MILNVACVHIEGGCIVLHGLQLPGVVVLDLVGMRPNVLQGAQYVVRHLGYMCAHGMIAKLIGHIIH